MKRVARDSPKSKAKPRPAVPVVVDHFSFGIPGFRPGGQPSLWYAAWKRHCGLYPMSDAIRRAHAADLAGYRTAKGTIQFSADAPLAKELVRRLVKARVAELKAKVIRG